MRLSKDWKTESSLDYTARTCSKTGRKNKQIKQGEQAGMWLRVCRIPFQHVQATETTTIAIRNNFWMCLCGVPGIDEDEEYLLLPCGWASSNLFKTLVEQIKASPLSFLIWDIHLPWSLECQTLELTSIVPNLNPRPLVSDCELPN